MEGVGRIDDLLITAADIFGVVMNLLSGKKSKDDNGDFREI